MSHSIAKSVRGCANMDSVVHCWQLSMSVVMLSILCCIVSIEDLVCILVHY